MTAQELLRSDPAAPPGPGSHGAPAAPSAVETEATSGMSTGAALDSTPGLPPQGAEPSVVIRPRRGLFDLDLRAVWDYRQLVYFIVWRDIKIRYKQTVIGAGWAVIQPLMTMLIFSIIFGSFAKIPSDGLPYPVFAYAALLPWNLFAASLSRCSASVVGDGHLISKVYFPRLIMPLAGPISGLIDFAIGFVILLGLMGWYGLTPTWRMLPGLPVLLLFALLTAMAVGLFLAALNVKYRDVGYTVPFLIQIWMYASPVAYPASLVPARWRGLYSLNPMAGVIEGFRWVLFGKGGPDLTALALSAGAVLLALAGGVIFFKHCEPSFADFV